MNFFKFIVQQYKDYKVEEVTLYTRCDTHVLVKHLGIECLVHIN